MTREVGTPDVVLAELAHYYERRPHPNRDAAIEAAMSTSALLPTTPQIALAAGVLRGRLESTRKGIGIVDCIVLETARAHGATLLTGDPHLKGLKSVQFLA